MKAQSGIGAAGTLELAAQTISATNASGDINLANAASGASTADLAVTDGAGAITFSQTGGPLSVNARTLNGSITVTNVGNTLTARTVTAGGSGNAKLETVNAGDIVIGQVDAGNNICLISVGNVQITNDSGNVTSANGAIAIWAKGGDVNQFVGSIQSGNGNIYLAGSNITQRAGAAIQTTGSGAVVLNAINDLNMNGIVRSASGDIVMGAGTVLVNGTLHAGRNVGIESRSSITGPGVIEAQAIALRAATNIGEDAGNRLHVKANKLATEAGDSVFISAAGSVESAVVDIQPREQQQTSVRHRHTCAKCRDGQVYRGR